MAALSVLGLAMLQTALRSTDSTNGGTSNKKAGLLADAGLSEAMDSLRAGGSGNLGSLNAPVRMGEGLFWVEADNLPDGRIQLTSTGMVGSGRIAAGALIQPPVSPLFEAVLNTADTLNMAEGVLVDSYQSTLGSYASQAVNIHGTELYAEVEGDIRSNADIKLGSNGLIFGDATPGIGETVTYGTGSYLYGSDAPATENFVFPPIQTPALPVTGNYDVAPGASSVLPAGDYGFDDFTIGAAANLRIEGPANIVVTNFDGKKDGILEIDARLGPVTIYCLNSYAHASGFEAVPVAGSPMAVAFMLDGNQGVQFNNGTKVRGAYYAPNGAIKFASGCEFWGSLAASQINMANGMRFHFDEDLAGYWGGAGQNGQEFTLVAWFDAAVSPAALLIDRRDAFVALDVDRAAALTVGQARTLDIGSN
jgi:hypothetical protein